MASTQGMETGYRFEGSLAGGLLALSMQGRVAITPKQDPAFAVQAKDLQVSYDFHNPREDVKALVERLLDLPALPSF